MNEKTEASNKLVCLFLSDFPHLSVSLSSTDSSSYWFLLDMWLKTYRFYTTSSLEIQKKQLITVVLENVIETGGNNGRFQGQMTKHLELCRSLALVFPEAVSGIESKSNNVP